MLALTRSPVRYIIVWEGRSIRLPKASGFLFVGSTAEEVGFRKNTTAKALHRLRRLATSLVTSLAYAEVACLARRPEQRHEW